STDPSGTATHVTAGGDVVIASSSTMRATEYVDTRAGAIIKAEIAKGILTTSNTSRATIGNKVSIDAGGDFTLQADNSSDATLQVISKGGGVFSHAEAQSSQPMSFETHATVGQGATINAGGNLATHTDTSVDALNEVESFSGGLVIYAGSFSNHNNDSDHNAPSGISIIGHSTVDVGKGATLTADTVSMQALISHLHGAAHAGAEAFLVVIIGGAAAYAEADLEVDATAQVLIHGGSTAPTKITGTEGVDLIGLTKDVNLERKASRLAVALIPVQEASADATDGKMSLTSLVSTEQYVTIIAGARAMNTVLANPDSSVSHLALYVDRRVEPITALVGTFRLHTETGYWGTVAHHDLHDNNDQIGHYTTGDSVYHNPTKTSVTGTVEWDADVTILGGLSGHPTLVIDDKGNVAAVNGITLNGSSSAVNVGDSVDPGNTGSFSVNDITNAGAVLMSADQSIKNNATSSTVGWPLFTFSDSLSGVTIIDHSKLNLDLNKIDVIASSTTKPLVRLLTKYDVNNPNASSTPPYAL